MEFSEIQEVKNMVDFRSSKISEFKKEKDEDFPLIPEKRVLIEPFNKSDEELDDILKDIQTEVTQTQISELQEGKNNEKQAHFDESKKKINNSSLSLKKDYSPSKKTTKEHDSSSSHKRNKSEGETLKQDLNKNFMKLNGEEIASSHNDKLIAPSALSKRIYSDHQEVIIKTVKKINSP